LPGGLKPEELVAAPAGIVLNLILNWGQIVVEVRQPASIPGEEAPAPVVP
jgi:hypothetical protein